MMGNVCRHKANEWPIAISPAPVTETNSTIVRRGNRQRRRREGMYP
jgi:hypothetical protein